MNTLDRLRRHLAIPLAALALSVAACSGDDDRSDQADTGSAASEDETTSSAPSQESSDDEAAAGEPVQRLPQAGDLDIEMRNPDGTVLTISHIAIEDDSILVDMEIVNGSPRRISIHSTAGGEGELRLVDDAGNSYSFVPPPGEASAVYTTIEQGETLSGTYAFLGPLVGRPGPLRLVTNVAPDDVDNWSLDDEIDRGVCCLEPGFVVEIDLPWD
jgi:hypothetical protein